MNLGPDVLDFSSNTSPLGCPRQVVSRLRRGLGRIEEYPDANHSELLAALSRYTGVDAPLLMAGNGASEIIYNFASAMMSRGSRVLIPAPTFAEYEYASALHGASPSFFESMDLASDIDSFASAIPRGGFVFLCNPNNPTGKLLTRGHVRKIVYAARKRSSVVFVDECFIEMVPDSDESVLGDVRRSGNLLVLRSLTKSFGLPGIRIGYAAGPRRIIDALRGIQVPWSVNSLAQDAAIAALGFPEHLESAKRVIRREAEYLVSRINDIDGFCCHDTSTAFILVRSRTDSTLLQKRLLERNILVRDCKNFRGLGRGHVRVAVRSHGDNRRLVRTLEELA